MDRTSKIEEMMDKFRSVQTKQENEKNEINEILAAKDKALAAYIARTDKKLNKDLEAINSQISEKTLRIDKYKMEIEELANPSKKSEMAAFHQEIDGILNDASVIDAYNKEIAEMEEEIRKLEKSKEEKQSRAEERKDKNKDITEKEKQDVIEMSKETPETRKEKQKELNLANDEARKDLTMEKAAIEKDIKKVDLKLQQVLMDMEDFTYEYELDENGNEDRSKVKNGHEYSELDKKYKELTDEKNNLKAASELCDKYLAELKVEYEKQFKTINEMLKTDKEKSNEQTEVEQTEPEQTEPEQTEPEQTEPEQTEPEQTQPEQTQPEQTEPEQTTPEQTEPQQTTPGETSQVQEQNTDRIPVEKINEILKNQNRALDIKVSAKDNRVYLNGETIENLNIQEVLQNKNAMFKRIQITKLISEELETKNPLKIFSIRRKIDPVIIEAMARGDRSKNDRMIRDYIWSMNEKAVELYDENAQDFNIVYDLENSSLAKDVDNKMQKYARYANEVDGIEVKGLKERGFMAWFKGIMDRINTPRLDKAKEDITRSEEPKGFKAVDEKAQKLQEQNEKNIREELKYRQGTMDRFVKSYEELNGEKDFDLKTFMHQASRELSPSEYAELGRIVNGDRTNGGFKNMDKKAQELTKENEARLKRNTEIEKNLNEIFSNKEQKSSELREEDGVIVEKNDELYDAAVAAILSTGEVKTSTIQRTLGIGYSRAVKLMDQMEEQGIISYDVSIHGYKTTPKKQQSHKTQEGQEFSEQYKATVDHEKAQEAVQTSSEQPTVDKEK